MQRGKLRATRHGSKCIRYTDKTRTVCRRNDRKLTLSISSRGVHSYGGDDIVGWVVVDSWTFMGNKPWQAGLK
jgi:hypothetical protein